MRIPPLYPVASGFLDIAETQHGALRKNVGQVQISALHFLAMPQFPGLLGLDNNPILSCADCANDLYAI
jgi:hypothetical protein